MENTDIKKLLYKDNYIYIAAEEYFKFRKTQEWDEKYKFERLISINKELNEKAITPENVLEVVKYFQKQNTHPLEVLLTGVHWEISRNLPGKGLRRFRAFLMNCMMKILT